MVEKWSTRWFVANFDRSSHDALRTAAQPPLQKNDAGAPEPHAMIKNDDSIHPIKYCVVTPPHSTRVV